MEDNRIGTELAGHRIEAVIGRGGMGVVYLAEHLHLRRKVALKVLAPELAGAEGFRERFLRESRIAAQVQHPNVVTVYDAGEADGMLWIAMQYISGTDLAALLRDAGRLEPARALRITEQMAEALDVAHDAGLVHRDVKPANVLIAGNHCYLTDFGLTKPTNSNTAFTQTGQFVGTLDYVAPEQIRGGDVDHRTDVYALGCMLHECLTGRRPFVRDTEIAVIYAHLEAEPPKPTAAVSSLPPAIDAVVAKAMAKLPEDRFQTAPELVEAARAALEGGAPVADAGATRQSPAPAGPTAPVDRGDATAASPPPQETSASPTAPEAPDPITSPLPPSSPGRTPPPGPVPPAPTPPGPPAKRDGGFPAWAVAAIAIGLLAVGGLVALLAGGSEDEPAGQTGTQASTSGERTETTETERELPRRGARVEVGAEPFGVVARDGRVYVSSPEDGTISVIDAGSRRAVREPIEVLGAAYGLTMSGGVVWAADSATNSVHAIDAASGRPGRPIRVGSRPFWVALGGGSLWVSNSGDDTVSRVDLRSRRVTETIEVGSDPRGIATTPSSVWVANFEDDTLTRLDIRTGRVLLDAVPVGDGPRGMSIKDGRIWVANAGDGTISVLSNSTGEPLADPIEIGGAPFATWAGDRYVWATDEENGTVTRIDPETRRIVGDPIRIGESATGVRSEAGAVWVVDTAGGFVVKLNE